MDRCSLLSSGGLGGGDGFLLLSFDCGAGLNPLGSESGDGVAVDNLAGESSNPDVDLVGDLDGGVSVNFFSLGGENREEVLLSPLVA